jgi:hypothetical protein
MEGEVSGPVGVSLAAWYSGRANEAKLGIQCLKKTNEAQEGQNFLGIIRRREVP